MYIKSEEITRSFLTKSKTGKEFYRPRKKIVHTFRCDYCNQKFKRDRHQINKKRVNNDFKHFCEKCCDHARFTDLGREKYHATLISRIGEKRLDADGYVQIYMGPNYTGTGVHGGAVREHILVMERSIGRQMIKGEVVHHIDGDKTNNDINNLQLMTVAEHNQCHAKSEEVVFELLKKDIVGYDRVTKRYYSKL